MNSYLAFYSRGGSLLFLEIVLPSRVSDLIETDRESDIARIKRRTFDWRLSSKNRLLVSKWVIDFARANRMSFIL